MRIQSIVLKQFRCFTSTEVAFTKPVVIIKGSNGAGKTSLLEALYYACYLRSFRTRTTREMIQHGTEAFSVKIQFNIDQEDTNMSVGYSPARRLIKLNNTAITSYKDLLSSYRIIALTEDDLLLIKGMPDVRRHFLDQAITLVKPEYPAILKKHAAILEQRNALLQQHPISKDSYELWTSQLSEVTQHIRTYRAAMITELEASVNELITNTFDNAFSISLTYKPKSRYETVPLSQLIQQEQFAGHSLIGSHLDDCSIEFQSKSSKQYASKGQQKLIALLLKIAQPATRNPESCTFILDDVLSDLDNNRIRKLIRLLASYKTQVIMTSPLTHPFLDEVCSTYDYESINFDTLK
jgi:DNA replication and repair protein RecF